MAGHHPRDRGRCARRGSRAVRARSILRRQAEAAEDIGLAPWMASELEFTVFDETPGSLVDKGYTGLRPHGAELHPELVEQIGHDEDFLLKLRETLVASGIPVESVKSEYSVGQFEMVVSPGSAMDSADRHVVYKLAVREVARRYGLAATFMSKWHESFGGSSCHVHISLNDGNGHNVFAEGRDDDLRHFVAGVQRYARDVFLLWAPYPNSYKRFQDGSFAPTALGWGDDNRTAAIRVTGTGPGRHIENRIPGADSNPYLAYAGLLAAGLAGIEDKLDPETEAAGGNAYGRNDQPLLPRNVEEAIEAFESSAFARERLGGDVVDHVANFCDKEAQASRMAVTDWDRRRLFDV
ncbi:MAG: glutamine synthetase family protein [Nocardioidaceae bacterium]